MHRIDDPSAVGTLPPPRAQGTPGYFSGGSPGAGGFAATIVRHEFLNSLQEEITAVIETAGIVLNKTNNAQLLAALRIVGKGFSNSFQDATPGTRNFTVPAGINKLFVRLWGGGGGGGGSANATIAWAGSGGGGGGYAEGIVSVTPGQVISYTVGAAGAGGPAQSPGPAGGSSGFGGLFSATGGFGGNYQQTTSTVQTSGGVGSSGSLNLQGGYGTVVFANGSSGQALGGMGGNGGGGGGMGGGFSPDIASSGLIPGGGGGGGGGPASRVGGAGAVGMVLIWW